MSDEIVKICKMANGYEVEVCDPEQQKKNSNPKSVYKDPWKSYGFKTTKEVTAFLGKVMDNLEPEKEDMGTEFQRAIEEDD